MTIIGLLCQVWLVKVYLDILAIRLGRADLVRFAPGMSKR